MARELFERCEHCEGNGILDQTAMDRMRICIDPPGSLKIERLPNGTIVCPFCTRGFIQTGLTMSQVERALEAERTKNWPRPAAYL